MCIFKKYVYISVFYLYSVGHHHEFRVVMTHWKIAILPELHTMSVEAFEWSIYIKSYKQVVFLAKKWIYLNLYSVGHSSKTCNFVCDILDTKTKYFSLSMARKKTLHIHVVNSIEDVALSCKIRSLHKLEKVPIFCGSYTCNFSDLILNK